MLEFGSVVICKNLQVLNCNCSGKLLDIKKIMLNKEIIFSYRKKSKIIAAIEILLNLETPTTYYIRLRV